MKNKNGNPHLDKGISHLIYKLGRRGCSPIVMFDHLSNAQEMCNYANYFKFLKESEPAISLAAKITMGYEDYLQIPLQPLMDHLQSATYEAFEMDPVKYTEYENAIYSALVDKKAELNDRQL
jgi:protein arginine N-methyltransferase 5